MAAKKKTPKKKMKTLQKRSQLSVEQLAVIIKGLSRKDRDKLDELMEQDYEITDEMYKSFLEREEASRKDPNRMIPWNKAKEMLLSGR